MPLLAVLPTQAELDACLGALSSSGSQPAQTQLGRITGSAFPHLGVSYALGGLGKAQFAAQTQHLLDSAQWTLVVCAGAAGALSPALNPGDVVIATETIEHDIRKASRPLQPRFAADESWLGVARGLDAREFPFRLHFGPIASGDEDIVTPQRRRDLHQATGCLAVAWEGAGGARAAAFSGIPFLEIRVVADLGTVVSSQDFHGRLNAVMPHLNTVLSGIASAGGLTTA